MTSCDYLVNLSFFNTVIHIRAIETITIKTLLNYSLTLQEYNQAFSKHLKSGLGHSMYLANTDK